MRTVPATVAETLARARQRLAAAPFAPSPREAALLLGHVLGWGEAKVLAHDDESLAAPEAARFEHLLSRRLGGEPVAYLVGHREFYGRPFRVDRRVLIPRPETEHLVEAALVALAEAGSGPRRRRVLDIGTGSGCLAVTLALEAPAARVTASDLSLGALALAADNAHRLAADVRFAAADLTSAFSLDRFDLVVSNPPYIDPAVAPSLSSEVVEHEPGLALFAAEAGRAAIRQLLIACGQGLAVGARLLLEVGHDQAAAVLEGAAASGLQTEGVVYDYAGIPRVVRLRRSA